MKHQYESEILYHLMERDGFNIPSSVPPYEAEIKAYLINQVKQAYPKLTDYEAEWLLYNYTKHLPADFPVYSVTNVTNATFENVVPFAFQSAILKGSTKYRDIETGEILEVFEDGRNLELVSVKMPVLTTTGKNLFPDINFSNNHIYKKVANGIQIIKDYESAWTPMFDNLTIPMPKGDYVLSAKLVEGEYTGGVMRLDYADGTISREFWISSNDGSRINHKFNNTSDKILKRINVWNPKGNAIFQYQLEQGTQVTSYEPYKSNILSTSEDVELRGVGDVKDELDCLTREVTQRIGEIVLDGSEEWKNFGDETSTTWRTSFRLETAKKSSLCICDRFIYSRGATEEKQKIYITTTPNLSITLKKEQFPTLNDFKTWLSQTKPKVQYELATPIVKTVDLSSVNEKGESTYFMPLEGTMHVTSSSETIQPSFNMSVPVEATTQNLASFINMKMEE